MSATAAESGLAYEKVVRDICNLNWRGLTKDELVDVAWAYYRFSIQFRENLEIACSLYPDDPLLKQLDRGERNTDNLSPWPGVAAAGEIMNHDEFMRRALALTPIPEDRRRRLEALGDAYLKTVRAVDKTSRAVSTASFENGGLAAVFRSILTAPRWEGPLLKAFQHFLVEHIRFDDDPDAGHGALCRNLVVDDRVLPMWSAFRELFVNAIPGLTRPEPRT
jgi:hypothetical protein